jgi:N-acetylglucosamine-6-phosphate deacetylase
MLDAGERLTGGRPVRLRDGAVRLPDGTLAGQRADDGREAVRNLVASGADWKRTVHAASTARRASSCGAMTSGGLSPALPRT